jgi:hypothetical protein
MLSQSAIERERYEARLKGMRDQACLLIGARERAWKEGWEQGYKEGLIIGQVMGRIFAYQTHLRLLVTPAKELEKLSLQELTRLMIELERQLFPPPVEADQPIVVSAADHSSTRTHLP